MRGRRRGAQSGGGVGGVGGARGHNNRLEAGDGAGDGGDGVAGVFDFAVPQRAAARPSHPATLVRRPFGGHRKAALRGRFLHFSILPRRAFRRGKAENDWRKMRLVNPQNGSNMKKTIFTFFVACNLAISGFFAVLATSPALAAECPLCEAAAINNVAEVRRLLNDGADPNQVGANGHTALMRAAFGGHSETAKVLLDNDAVPNQADEGGWTALIIAALTGHSQIVKVLLDGGANPNQAIANGFTALMVAAGKGHTQFVKALLDSGANPNQAAADGSTALTHAVFNGRVDVVKILPDTSDSSWFFGYCKIDEMTDGKRCFASSHPVAFSVTNAAGVVYMQDCTTRSDGVAVVFNTPKFYDIDTQSFPSLSFLVRSDDKPAMQMRFVTQNLFLSQGVAFYNSAEAVALIKRSNNVRIRFPFRRKSKVIKFPMNGATAAIEKAQKECKK